ncbi:MAG: VOC family protein [Nocardioidaceae bacterium]
MEDLTQGGAAAGRRTRTGPHARAGQGDPVWPKKWDTRSKSRLHLDFRPDDQDAEVARLVAHGAQRVDIGPGDQSWVVLADPEGNEFCVLGQRRQ